MDQISKLKIFALRLSPFAYHLHFFWVLLAAKYGMRMILNGLKMISEKIE